MRAVLAFVAAAAAVTTEATELCRPADVERYFAELESRAALSA